MRARPYQQYSIDAAIASLQNPKNERRTMLIAPTGSGKTYILATVVNEMLNIIGLVNGKKPRALVLVHRNKINDQNKEAFEKNHGRKTCIFAGEMKSLAGQVIFGMVQTMARLYQKLPAFDILVIDEFHHAVATSYLNIINDQAKKNSNLYVLGVTATPNRGDEQGLINVTNNFCAQIMIQDLVELGYLVPLESRTVDLFPSRYANQVGKSEYFEKTTKSLIEQIKQIHERRKIVIFASGKLHMNFMEGALNKAGIKAISIHSGMIDGDIRRNLREFEQSNYRILLNIDIATEGYDYPPIDCVILMRRVGNKSLYTQMVGRGLRTIDISKYPGVFKKDCLLLDFGDNVRRYGNLYQKVDLVGKEIYLPTCQEKQEREQGGEGMGMLSIMNRIQQTTLHGKGILESFTFEGKYVRGVCGVGKSLFILQSGIFIKKGSDVIMLATEEQAIEYFKDIAGDDIDLLERFKNEPIESYQIKLLIDKFDIVGCSKYRASVLINFLAIRDKLCKQMYNSAAMNGMN